LPKKLSRSNNYHKSGPNCFCDIRLNAETRSSFIAPSNIYKTKAEYSVQLLSYACNCCTISTTATKFQELPNSHTTIPTTGCTFCDPNKTSPTTRSRSTVGERAGSKSQTPIWLTRLQKPLRNFWSKNSDQKWSHSPARSQERPPPLRFQGHPGVAR
jgi:hypothetical protein